jgi:hypothetical protein
MVKTCAAMYGIDRFGVSYCLPRTPIGPDDGSVLALVHNNVYCHTM